jgi:hypothetical protein
MIRDKDGYTTANLPKPSLFDEPHDWRLMNKDEKLARYGVDDDEEAEFARQCQLSDEAEEEALIRYGIDRSILLPKD